MGRRRHRARNDAIACVAWMMLVAGIVVVTPGAVRALPGEPAPGAITTVAGTGVTADSPDGGLAVASSLASAPGIAFDPAGNLYIADATAHRVRRVDAATGVISAFAGDGNAAWSGDGGSATLASLMAPTGVAVDSGGNVYIVDADALVVRRVDGVTGIITTVAGSGVAGDAGDGGPATGATFTSPYGVAVDAAGDVYVSDGDAQRVRRIDTSTGLIHPVAGTGVGGFSGDGGSATAAQLLAPRGLAVAPDGDVLIADLGNRRVRRVDAATGTITTMAGTGSTGFGGDGGAATAAAFASPFAVASDAAGNVFVADRDNLRVRRIDSVSGVIGTVAGRDGTGAGGDGGHALIADLLYPHALAVAPNGLVAVGFEADPRVRAITPAAPLTEFVNTEGGYTGDGFLEVEWNGYPTPISAFRLTVEPDGITRIVPASNTSAVFDGLGNGVERTITIEAFDGWSFGPISPWAPLLPRTSSTVEVQVEFIRDFTFEALDPEFTLTAAAFCFDGIFGTYGPTVTLTDQDLHGGAIGLVVEVPAGGPCILDIQELRGRQSAPITSIEGFAPYLADEATWVRGVDVLPRPAEPFNEFNLVNRSRDLFRVDEDPLDAQLGITAAQFAGELIELEVRLTPRSKFVRAFWTDDSVTGGDIRDAEPRATVECENWDYDLGGFGQPIEWVLDGHPSERDVPVDAGTWPRDECVVVVESFVPDPSHGREFVGVEVFIDGEDEEFFTAGELPAAFEFEKEIRDHDAEGTATADQLIGITTIELRAVHAPPADPTLFDEFDVDATGPAPVNAFLLGLLANAAYEESWDPDFSARTDESWQQLVADQTATWGLTDVQFVVNPTTGTQAFTVRRDDALFVSLRGTDEQIDVLIDGAVPLIEVPGPAGPVTVHTGFWSALASIYPSLLAIAEEDPDVPVWLTGHSLGGALATLAAMRLAMDGITVAGIHTFGAPNVGGVDHLVAHDVTLGLRDRTQRWVGQHDIIPMAFDLIPGYVDVGVTNVFVRLPGSVPRTDFDVAIDVPTDPLTAPGLDDHDIGLYVARLWEWIDRQAPTVAARLPEPEPPYLRPPSFDTQRAVLTLATYFTDRVDLVIAGVRDEMSLLAEDAAELLAQGIAELSVDALAERWALITRVLAEGYGWTVDAIEEVLAYLGATADEIAAAIASLVSALLDELAAGWADLKAEIVTWAEFFDVDPLAFLDGAFAERFDVEALLAAIELPTIDAQAIADGAVDAALDLLEAQGVTVDWVEGGVGGRPDAPDGERLQLRFTVDLTALIEASGAPDPIATASELLAGLGELPDLDPSGSLTADGTLTVVAGVGETGYYVSGESFATLSVDGSLTVSGTTTVFGDQATLSGTATAELDIVVAPLPQNRVVGETAAAIAEWTGSLTAGVSIEHPITDLAVATAWDVTGPPPAASLSATTVGATVRIPDTDIVLTGSGTLRDDGRWDLDGALSTGASFGGIALDDASFDLVAGPTSLDGTITVDVALELADEARLPLSVTITLDDGDLVGIGTLVLDDVSIGTAPFAEFQDSTLVVTYSRIVGEPLSQTATLSGELMTLLPGRPGSLELEDFSGTVAADGTLDLTADLVRVSLGGFIDVSASGAALTLGPGADGPLLSFGGPVTASVPALGDLSVTVTDLVVERDGTVSFSSITVAPGDLPEMLPLGDLIPLRIDSLELRPTVPGDLASFVVDVDGAVDLSAYDDLPFTPIVGLGDQVITPDTDETGRQVSFTIAVESLSEGRILPIDVGPVTLGFADLDLGSATVGASITLGGLVDGEFSSEVTATATITGDAEVVAGGVDVSLDATITPITNGTRIDLDGEAILDGSVADLVSVTGLRLTADLAFVVDDDGIAFEPPVLDALTYDELRVSFGDYADLVARDATLDLTPTLGEHLATFGGTPAAPGLEVEFGDGFAALDGFGGGAGNVAVEVREGDGGVPVLVPVLLPGFYADLSGPADGAAYGLPDWLPIVVDEIGVTFPAFDPSAPLPPGGLVIDASLLTGLRLRFSGGLEANDSWPITARVEDLEVDVARLLGLEPGFPIVGVGGGGGGIEPFTVGPITIGGVLQLGTVDVDVDPGPDETIETVLYGRILGEFAYGGIGAGVDLVVTQYGPVLAEVVAPMAIPLGNTGILLAGVRGGIQFGGDGFTPPDDPIDLLLDPGYDLGGPVTEASIAHAVEGCAQQNAELTPVEIVTDGCLTWEEGGTLYVGATLTTYVSPGAISGDVILGVDLRFDDEGSVPDLRIAGHGQLDVFGLPIGEAGFLLSLDDPLGPVLDVAALAPGGPGSPIGFVLPTSGRLTMRLDTEGIALGTLLATRAFVERVSAGAVEIGGDVFDDALDALAGRLDAQRTSLMTGLVLDVDANGSLSSREAAQQITPAFLRHRLLGTGGVPALLPTSLPGSAAARADLAEVVGLVQQAIVAAIDDLVSVAPQNFDGLSLLDPVYLSTGDNPLLSGEQRRAIAAYARVFQETLVAAFADAGSEFNAMFDPFLEVRGGLQPVILGVPFGEPTEEATLRIDRDGVTIGMQGSLIKMFVAMGGEAGRLAAELGARIGVVDEFELAAQLPLTGVVDGLLTGGPLSIDPFDLDWSVEFSQATRIAGFEVGRLTGVLLPPGNESYVDARVWRTWEGGGPTSPDLIPVNTPEHYAAIVEHGGLLMTTRLRGPELLADPLGVIDRLGLTPPASVLEYPAFIQQNIDALTALTEVGTYQLYLPSLLELVPGALVGDIWDVPADVEEILDTAYVEGTWDVDLLGLDVVDGFYTIGGFGLPDVELSVELPAIDRRLDLRFAGSEVTMPDLSTVVLPAIGFDIALDGAALRALDDTIGLPSAFGVRITPDARLRGYSPGYDLDGDELQVRGGIEAALSLGAQPLFASAEFDLTWFAPSLDIRAVAIVDELTLAPGIVVDDAAVELSRSGNRTTVAISGAVSTPLGSATVDGSLGPTLVGTLALELDARVTVVGGFRLQTGLTVRLTRPPLGGLVATVTAGGSVTFPEWIRTSTGGTTATFTGTVGATSFDLLFDVPGIRVFGQQISGVTARLRRNDTTLQLDVEGSVTILGATGTVDGFVTIEDGIPSGSLSWNTGSLSLGAGWTAEGTFTLEVGGGDVSIDVDGTVAVPGFATFGLDGLLTRSGGAWLGPLTVEFGTNTRRIGGSTSSLGVRGSFTLERSSVGTGVVTTFRATNARVDWIGAVLFPETTLTFSSTGSVSATIGETSFTVGRFSITFAGASFSASANGVGPSLAVNGPSIEFVGAGLGGAVDLTGFTVGADGVPTGPTANRTLELGLLELAGAMRLERPAGSWVFSIEGTPTIRIPGLADPLRIEEFAFGSNGAFDVTLVTRRLGPNSLHLRNASMRLVRGAGVSAATTLRISSVSTSAPLQLQLPVGDPIDLSALTPLVVTSNGTMSAAFTRALRLGPGFVVGGASASSQVPFALTLDDDGLRLAQTSSRFLSILGASATLTGFAAGSDGTFTGSISAALRPLGYPLASATLSISKPPGWVDARIDVDADADLGLVETPMEGWVATNGRFDLSGAASFALVWSGTGTQNGVPNPFAFSVEGELTVRLRNTGVTGTFDGTVCAIGSCVTLDSALQSNGRITGTIVVPGGGTANDIAFSIPLLNPPLTATNLPPSIAAVPDIIQAVPASATNAVVQYPVPGVSDDLSNSPTITCSPAPGSTFPLGSTVVSCTATDGAGLTATRSFVVTVVADPLVEPVPGQFEIGDEITVVSGGFAVGSSGLATLYSDPIPLGSSTASATGEIRFTFAVPNGLAPGDHTVVLSGVAPDGSPRLVSIPVEIVAAAPTPTTPTVPLPTTPLPNGGRLPVTGGSAPSSTWPTAVFLVGLLLVLTARRRPGQR